MGIGRKVTVSALAVALLAATGPIFGAAQPAAAQGGPGRGPITTRGNPATRDDEVLVKFVPGLPAADEAALHRQVGGQVVREIPALDVRVVRVPRGQAQQRARAYEANRNVEYAELNGIAYATWAPNDPEYTDGSQWALHQASGPDIGAPGAWEQTRCSDPASASQRIAILDTGVREVHPDLVGKVAARANWTWEDALSPTQPNRDATDDRNGHGTHVAGIAAAVTNNGAGVAGVAPNCRVVVGKVLGSDGSGSYDYIANGVLWAVGCDARDRRGNCVNPVLARTLNLSLGGTYNSRTLRDAVDKAWGRGAVIVAAAGNDGVSTAFYPAAYSNAIAVAATDRADAKASWSNHGSWVDLAAPGVDILSTMIPERDASGYVAWSGTSMAAPHVAGVAALAWASGCGTNGCVRTAIESKADQVSGTGSLWAKGRLNACRVVNRDQSADLIRTRCG